MIRTINEVRADRGLAPVAWGDRPVIPFSDASLAVLPTAADKAAPKENNKDSEEGDSVNED